MSTKYRTASKLGQGADEIGELLEALDSDDHKISGEKLEKLKHVLRKAEGAYRKGAKAAIKGTEDVEIVVGDDDPPAKKKRRRRIPAGTFQFRPRECTLNGRVFRGATIAHMFCEIADHIVKGDGKVDEKAIATAIQKAYPENNYRPHRVEIDLDKYQHRKFRCQREPDDYEAAVEEAFGEAS
jgi:hypothetical protein